MRILHLSDSHLLAQRGLHRGVVDSSAALTNVLAAAENLSGVDAVLCTGDLSDDGSADSYRFLKEQVDSWAERHGAAALYLMGNHDQRAGFEEVLGERTGVHTVAGVRIVRLDSSVPGKGYGVIDEKQLAWLDAVLAESRAPAADGPAPTIVALHHPPVAAITPLLRALELQEPEALLDICARRGVAGILAGHFHHSLATVARGAPVFVAPAIVNTTDITAPPDHERAVVGSGFAIAEITVSAERHTTVRHTVRAVPHAARGLADGTVIFDMGLDEIAVIATAAGPEH